MSADDVFVWANWTLIFALVLGVLATYGIVASGTIRDEALKKELKEKDVAIAASNARTAEAVLELAQVKKDVGARHFDRHAFLEAIKGNISEPVEIYYSTEGSEPMELAQQINLALEESGWKVLFREPLPNSRGALPPAMAMGGQPKGVTVVAHLITEQEEKVSEQRMLNKDWIKTPYSVLSCAVGVALGTVSGSGGGPNAPAAGTLRIVVAARI